MFGNHTPTQVQDKAGVSPFATFTRGTLIPGKRWTFKFDNGYGASVINDGYGHETGLYELAVLGPDGHINYETPITSDVVGWLSEDEVAATLDQIAALGPNGREVPDESDPLDPATRVLDALGREWAVKNNGVWAALGHAMSVDCYAVLVARYGPCEVLG